MHVRALMTVVLIACTTAIAAAQGPRSPLKYKGPETQPAITAADAMTRLYVFADDSMMGRGAGDPGGLKGTAYIEREVRRMGLVPAGDNGTFFQAVPIYRRSFDMSSSLKADDVQLVAGKDYYPLHLGGTPRSLNGRQVIYAGTTLDAANMIPAAQAVGKVVVVAGPTPGIARRYPDAAGFIIIPADYVIPQLREYAAEVSTLMHEPADTVSVSLTLAVPSASIASFLGVPLQNARPGTLGRTLSGEVRFNMVDAPARNVVAIIRGSDSLLRKQFVAIGAHNDHLGIRHEGAIDTDSVRAFNQMAAKIYMTRTHELPEFPGTGLTADEKARVRVNLDSLRRIRPARPDSVYNGADDDGSGSVGLLEIAEKFSNDQYKPKRSLLFVWHTGEELALFGSEFFTDHPTVPRESIVAQLNIDMIGRGEASDRPGGNSGYLQLIGSRRLSSELGDLLEKVNIANRHGMKFDYTFDAAGHPEQYYCRSDHYEYARYGIPVAFMSTGGHIDYHQVTDEPQYISYTHLARVAGFVADVAAHIANLDHRIVVDHAKPDPKGQCVQ
ncbi:MAG TPA: M28 family peptidase [Gemmatimonadaceae bacterium]|nr:M28 family peptidase [Gemmatimonadaceae bacterium]